MRKSKRLDNEYMRKYRTRRNREGYGELRVEVPASMRADLRHIVREISDNPALVPSVLAVISGG